ncbi:MAG TPA: DUF3426 domain-containing protein [Janthinobacterium sp.]|nr:DUF3426 domain-containing protein [Janthinobacterium sp.]
MALATKCPHCNTTFRVAADQLKLRGGIVRCGSCKEVFDGNAALVDPAAPARPAHPAAAVSTAPAEPVYSLDFDTSLDPFGLLPKPAPPKAAPEPIAPAEEAKAKAEAEAEAEAAAPAPVIDFELDLDIPAEPEAAAPTPAPANEAPAHAAEPEPAPELECKPEPELEPELEPEPPSAHAGNPAQHEDRREPSFDLDFDFAGLDEQADEHIVAVALPGHEDLPEAEEDAGLADARQESPMPAAQETSAASEPDEAAAEALQQGQQDDAGEAEPDSADGAGDASDADEPGFVKQGRRRQRMGRAVRIGMGAASFLLLIALLAQGMTTFRNQLAANVPALKPALVSACSVFGCRVEVPAQIDALSIEQGELQTLADNTFSYASILHNQSASAQAWPSIELTLSDAADKPVLRRVLVPRDYLAPTVDLAKGFAPHSEQAVKLYFELAQLKASGYHIAIFYP